MHPYLPHKSQSKILMRANHRRPARHHEGAFASTGVLAARITAAASKQTYFTIRLLVDRAATDDAFRAYAYFRWFDDLLDQWPIAHDERLAILDRQRSLLDQLYAGLRPSGLRAEERILADLIERHRTPSSGLASYIHHMMEVMAFDAGRRGDLISQADLDWYTRSLATAVTDALFYFIDRGSPAPQHPTRHFAAAGAHIAHMLRDTLDDNRAGYFNIPREYLAAHGISPQDVHSPPYLGWVKSRVRLARDCFETGEAFLTQVQSRRCRLAGIAYMARFEGVLNSIEADGYRLRPDYPERKTLKAGAGLVWSALSFALRAHTARDEARVAISA